jgi:hypothetical protein
MSCLPPPRGDLGASVALEDGGGEPPHGRPEVGEGHSINARLVRCYFWARGTMWCRTRYQRLHQEDVGELIVLSTDPDGADNSIMVGPAGQESVASL